MSIALNDVGAITLFVEDLARSKAFYRDVFGRPLIFEDANSAVFGFEHLMVNLLAIAEAPELIGPAAVGDRGSGARFQLTIWVPDTDAVVAALAARGALPLNGPMNRDWGQRTATFTDPDGHIWEVAQELPPATE